MGKGAMRVRINEKEEAPVLYTRLNDRGTGFEPERNLINFAAGLDGGSSVAADRKECICRLARAAAREHEWRSRARGIRRAFE